MHDAAWLGATSVPSRDPTAVGLISAIAALVSTYPQLQVLVNLCDAQDRELHSVFQIAEVTRPLMSVSRICEQGFECHFTDVGATVVNKAGKVVCEFNRDGGLYTAQMRLRQPTSFTRPAP